MDEYTSLLNENINMGAFEKLDVYVDNSGVVRIRKRTQYATAACGLQKDLIILSGKHHLTRLIVMHYHRSLESRDSII